MCYRKKTFGDPLMSIKGRRRYDRESKEQAVLVLLNRE